MVGIFSHHTPVVLVWVAGDVERNARCFGVPSHPIISWVLQLCFIGPLRKAVVDVTAVPSLVESHHCANVKAIKVTGHQCYVTVIGTCCDEADQEGSCFAFSTDSNSAVTIQIQIIKIQCLSPKKQGSREWAQVRSTIGHSLQQFTMWMIPKNIEKGSQRWEDDPEWCLVQMINKHPCYKKLEGKWDFAQPWHSGNCCTKNWPAGFTFPLSPPFMALET